ncbi:MAG: undecaprenyl-diphosphate phosphatase [Pseudomonadota bacterium]
MDLIQLLVLSLLQGLTEFLPISSSAHLILVPVLTHWEDQGLVFDVAVHVGTLLAVMLYFQQQLRQMFFAWLGSLRGRGSPEANLAWAVLLGTVPVGLAGLLLGDLVESYLRSPLIIATATIGFGLLLWWADVRSRRRRDEYQINWKDVLIIGCAQALALIPGTSRSGITITAALAMGLTRKAAARFSFLLSIPVIVLAGGYQLTKLINHPEQADWAVLVGGVVISGISAYLCIHLFLKLLDHTGMLPFVIYRLVLGCVLLGIFL